MSLDTSNADDALPQFLTAGGGLMLSDKAPSLGIQVLIQPTNICGALTREREDWGGAEGLGQLPAGCI